MFYDLRKWVSDVRAEFISYPGQVVEIGSRDVNGSVRDLFGVNYTGIDMIKGDGVNIVGKADEVLPDLMKFVPQFNTVICLETLEHDPRFWRTLDAINDAIAPNGHLILSTPTYGMGYHGYPKDYYRFSEDAFREVLFDGYKILDLKKFDKPKVIAAIGRRV